MSHQDERAFNQLLEFIEDNMDFETGFYNDAYLDRRITARMRRLPGVQAPAPARRRGA